MAGPLSNKVVTAKIAAHSRTGAQLDHSVQRQPPRRTNKHTSSTSLRPRTFNTSQMPPIKL